MRRRRSVIGKMVGKPLDGGPLTINPNQPHIHLISRGYLLGPISHFCRRSSRLLLHPFRLDNHHPTSFSLEEKNIEGDVKMTGTFIPIHSCQAGIIACAEAYAMCGRGTSKGIALHFNGSKKSTSEVWDFRGAKVCSPFVLKIG